jgi:hypothetical protein
MPATVLQRIVNELIERVRSMKDDENNQLWNRVVYGKVGSLPTTWYPIVGLEQGPEETVDEMFPIITKEVTLFLEFRFRSVPDVESADTFRYYLGRLQERLFSADENDFTLGGLSINVQEEGSNPEIEDATDTSPGGILIFKVSYRHKKGDPYKTPAEA